MYPETNNSELPENTPTGLAGELLVLDGARVLDIGCGPGKFTCFLAGQGAKVAGIDPNEKRIAAARALAEEQGVAVDFRVGVGEDLPFEDEAFDVVVFSNSLHHVPVAVIPAALHEARRVLSPGGLLYVMEPVPAGGHFEVGQPINDEREVRTVAYDAVMALGGSGFTAENEVFVADPKRHASFDDYKAHSLARNPQRADLFTANEDEMKKRFDRVGRKAGDVIVLDAALRVNVMRKVG